MNHPDRSHERILESSRKDAAFTAVVWVLSCAWVGLGAALFAYRPASGFWLGIPTWVIGVILIPWLACTAATCWYVLCVMRDEDLGEEAEPSPRP